jgi:hypothetical protein
MRKKLNDIVIRSCKPRARTYVLGDAACPGLRIRITPKGVKPFAFDYRDRATGKANASPSGGTRTCRWRVRESLRTMPARRSQRATRRSRSSTPRLKKKYNQRRRGRAL